jgi:hypothetical protein
MNDGGAIFRFARVLGCPFLVGDGQPIDPRDPARGWLSRFQDTPAGVPPSKVRFVGYDHRAATYIYQPRDPE